MCYQRFQPRWKQKVATFKLFRQSKPLCPKQCVQFITVDVSICNVQMRVKQNTTTFNDIWRTIHELGNYPQRILSGNRTSGDTWSSSFFFTEQQYLHSKIFALHWMVQFLQTSADFPIIIKHMQIRSLHLHYHLTDTFKKINNEMPL